MASSAEASAKTLEAAVEAAATKLGLREDQVEVEVLKQAVPSTFGKVGEPAVVRVTARESGAAGRGGDPTVPEGSAGEVPVLQASSEVNAAPVEVEALAVVAAAEPGPPGTPRPEAPSSEGGRARDSGHRHPEVSDPEAVAADTELAADFVEGLLDVLDVDGDITTWVDEGGGHVDVEGPKLGFLVGHDGEILAALQELTRLAVLRQTQRWTRLAVDVNGFKARRREELAVTAKLAAERVAQTGELEELEPMTAFDRKIVHDVVAAVSGAESESIGEDPNRRVVIRPALS